MKLNLHTLQIRKRRANPVNYLGYHGPRWQVLTIVQELELNLQHGTL